MSAHGRVLGSLAALTLLVASLAGCGSSANTDDPSQVAAGMLNALAKSDCKTVLELYPDATSDEEFPAEDCSNEMGGTRAIGTYTCSPTEGLENSATVANIRCKSDQDPDTLWVLVLERGTDAWVVSSASGR